MFHRIEFGRIAGQPLQGESAVGPRGAPASRLGVRLGPTAAPSGSPTGDAPRPGAPLPPRTRLAARAARPAADAALTSPDQVSLRLDAPWHRVSTKCLLMSLYYVIIFRSRNHTECHRIGAKFWGPEVYGQSRLSCCRDWRRGWESNPRATLTGRKLLILHIATKAESARNARPGYTAGTPGILIATFLTRQILTHEGGRQT